MDSRRIRTSVIDHLNHAAKHLPVAVTAIFRYESSYAAHNINRKNIGRGLYGTAIWEKEIWQATAILVHNQEVSLAPVALSLAPHSFAKQDLGDIPEIRQLGKLSWHTTRV